MSKPPPLTPGQLETVCKILGDTATGLTGTEIQRLLKQAGVRDVEPEITKWKRLFSALAKRQNQDRNADRIFAFIKLALDPARYVGSHAEFENRRSSVNAVLALCGYEFRADGKFGKVAQAATLSEAEARAHRLKAALSSRGVHKDVLAACRAELMQNNAFHAVLEATKSVAEKIRSKTGLQSDGGELVDAAFAGAAPLLKINSYSTDSEKSEQRGFSNLVKGMFGVFRNPTAHAPRASWNMSDDDALDLFTLASYIHRRVDGAK